MEHNTSDTAVKSSKRNIIIGAAAIAVLAILIMFCVMCLGGGVKGTVKKYVKSKADKKGGKTFYSITYPDAVIKKLKDIDKYDDIVDAYNDNNEDMIKDLEDKATMPKFDKIARKEKLKKSDLKHASNYFEKLCENYDADDDEVKVTKGYEVKVRTKRKNEDGKIKHDKPVICVVKVRGEGWKVIPMSADALNAYKK